MGCASSSVSSYLREAAQLVVRGDERAFMQYVTEHNVPLDLHLSRSQALGSSELVDFCDEPTLLIISALLGNEKVAACIMHSPQLAEFIDSAERLGGQRTAIYCAAERGFFKIVQLLLTRGANPNTGALPLHTAAQQGNLEICELLLQHRANIDGVDIDGSTALMAATRWCQHQAVSFLLGAGANAAFRNAQGRIAQEMVGEADKSISGAAMSKTHEAFDVFLSGRQKVVKILSKEEQEAQQEMQRQIMERGMSVTRGISARIAKLSLLQAQEKQQQQQAQAAESKYAAQRLPLISRGVLEQILYDTLTCHAVIFYLATDDACAASAYQMQLSDFLIALLVPFLDENEAVIVEEITRGSFAFIQKQQEAAKKDAVLRAQLEATERQIGALNRQTVALQSNAQSRSMLSRASSASSPNQSDPQGDWSKRFNKANAVFNAGKTLFKMLPF